MEALTAQDPARIGPFRLVARLGRGGMGRVYLGRDEGSGRHAAVKTIHGELAADPEFRTRFTQEVNAALRVRDEYIAEVVLADPAAAVPWLATAYVPGISVEDAVRKYGPMPAESVRVLGLCVSRAVAAIHAVGLVHRDLKPGNVLLTAQGPKVIDFGIARGVGDEGLTKTGMVAGSPPYMAPEQLVSGDFGPASDVFSLGSILHYAATAAGPYGRGGAQELYARAIAVGPTISPDLPESIAVPISRALSREPASRPSAAELVTALEQEPGEKPLPGWLPANVTQEILTQATEALSTASAAYNTLPPPGAQQGGPQPSFAPPGPPSNPSNPRNQTFGPPRSSRTRTTSSGRRRTPRTRRTRCSRRRTASRAGRSARRSSCSSSRRATRRPRRGRRRWRPRSSAPVSRRSRAAPTARGPAPRRRAPATATRMRRAAADPADQRHGHRRAHPRHHRPLPALPADLRHHLQRHRPVPGRTRASPRARPRRA